MFSQMWTPTKKKKITFMSRRALFQTKKLPKTHKDALNDYQITNEIKMVDVIKEDELLL